MDDNVYAVNKQAYHHGDLRRVLLQCATRIVEEEGLDRLSLRLLASRVGVSPMAPYRHFADKAALLAAIGEHGFMLLRERLVEAAGEASSAGALTAWGVAYVMFARSHPDLFRLMFGGPPAWQDSQGGDLADRPETVFGLLTAALRELFPSDEVELARLTVWSFIHGLASLIVDRRLNPFPPDVDQLTRDVSQFFARRFLPEPQIMLNLDRIDQN